MMAGRKLRINRRNFLKVLGVLGTLVVTGYIGYEYLWLKKSITGEEVVTNYKYVVEKPNGWFVTGQEADIMLSGIDFNDTGGPLLFNHPKGIASDGRRLLVSDTYNNRVLIWRSLPLGNEEPDLVLGQENFITNNPGDDMGGAGLACRCGDGWGEGLGC
jgi:hypothetical protein